MIRIREMKKTLIFVFTILTLSIFVFSEVRVGVINPNKVIQNTKRGKEITKRLEELGKSKQRKITEMNNEIKALEKELISPALNNETRERKTLLLQERRTKLKRYIEDSRKEFQIKYQKEMDNLRREIMPVITQIGKSKGFSLILDISTAGIAYFDQAIDVTDEVIKEYNLKYPKKNK